MLNERILRRWRREALQLRRDSMAKGEWNSKASKFVIKVMSGRFLYVLQQLSDKLLLEEK